MKQKNNVERLYYISLNIECYTYRTSKSKRYYKLREVSKDKSYPLGLDCLYFKKTENMIEFIVITGFLLFLYSLITKSKER